LLQGRKEKRDTQQVHRGATMLVREVMTSDPITIRPDSDYLAAIALMRAGNFRRLPVVDEQGRLVGLVSINDLNRLQTSDASTSHSKQHAFQQNGGVLIRVGEIMKRTVITIPPDYPIEEAAQMMLEHRFGSLPVVEGEHLIGIITDSDIFKMFVRMLGGGGQAIRLSVQVDNTPGQFAAVAAQVAGIGGNILSLASYPADSPDRLNLTMRVEGVPLEELITAIDELPTVEIRYTWDKPQAKSDS
jgi:acetoin utilization protein AcuB